MDRLFEFELYRVNLVDLERTLFDFEKPSVASDHDIINVLEHGTDPKFKVTVEGPRATYEWVLRSLSKEDAGTADRTLLSMILARSMTTRSGTIVTDNGIVKGESEPDPPLADMIKIFFDMTRHLVAVEHFSTVTASNRWRIAFQEIVAQSASDLDFHSKIELEPVPKMEEIRKEFMSFTYLTRLRVRLRLPNPELSRYAEDLYKEMCSSGIREYTQDMKNPKGLNKEEGRLPYAATEIAQAGYKKGGMRLEGLRDGRHEVVETGQKAAKGQISEVRDFVRGIGANTRTHEGRRVAAAILDEIDRVAPKDKT